MNWTKVAILVIALAAVIAGAKFGVDIGKTLTEANVLIEQVEPLLADEAE